MGTRRDRIPQGRCSCGGRATRGQSPRSCCIAGCTREHVYNLIKAEQMPGVSKDAAKLNRSTPKEELARRGAQVLSFNERVCSWWAVRDLNPRPPACHAGALPDCANGPGATTLSARSICPGKIGHTLVTAHFSALNMATDQGICASDRNCASCKCATSCANGPSLQTIPPVQIASRRRCGRDTARGRTIEP